MVLGPAIPAFASFELALITDNTTKTIHRYDVDAGVYLGSFGANRLSGTVGSICVDKANNWAYVVDGGSIKKFNYNTGEYLGGFFVGGSVRQINLANDGRLVVANAGFGAGPNLYTFGNSSATTSVGFNASTTTISAVQHANGSFGEIVNDTTFFRYVSRANFGTTPLTSILGGAATAVDLATRGNTIALAYGSGWGSIARAPIIGTGEATTFFPLTAPTITTGYSVTGISFGHVDAIALATNLTASQLGFVDSVNNIVTVRNLPSQIQNARDIAVVVAPEPATMLALAGGIAAMLRRQKRTA